MSTGGGGLEDAGKGERNAAAISSSNGESSRTGGESVLRGVND